MKPASARRISSHADGPDVARARGRPATSAPNGPISSARSVPRRGRAPGWSCCLVRHRRHGGAPHRDQCRRRSRAHAVLIVDQAGWHLTPKLAIPDNITVLALPPRSPELNPVENVWQFMRDNWLSNRIFKSYEDIVALCCQAWNNLIDQPWKIMSLGMRKWAHGF